MKKIKTIIPLMALLALLASCEGAASSIDSSSQDNSSTPAESSVIGGSDDTGSGESSSATAQSLASELELLSIGYDADIYLNDEAYGSIALNDEGVSYAYEGEDAVHYVPEELEDEPGINYVAEACINLANEIETDVYSWMEWDSMYVNFFSLLTEEDFASLGNGIYAFYPDEDEWRTEYASYQLTLEAADYTDISEITITLGEKTEISIGTSTDTYIAYVNNSGETVDTLLQPYDGESVSEIDTLVSKIQEGNYTLREEYLFDDAGTGEYVVDDSYTSDIYVSDGLAYDGWYELGYTEYEEGVYELTPVTDDNGNTLWYVNTDFYGYTWFDMVGGCRISSKLFESTGTEGEYSLIQGIQGLYADVSSYDPYASGYVTDITLTLNSDGSLALTCDYDGEYLITVTYYDIGTTVLPDETLTKANVSMLKMSDFSDDISSIADNGYDFATGLGTDDRNLWNAAFELIDLPYYGLDGIAYAKAESLDPFLASYDAEATTPYSLYIKYLYAYYDEDYGDYYYDYAYFYFAEYLIYHGFEETYEIPEGSEDGYYVYTASFEYGSEEHSVSLVDLGAYYSDSEGLTVDERFVIKIDMSLSA